MKIQVGPLKFNGESDSRFKNLRYNFFIPSRCVQRVMPAPPTTM